jgi:undecaprenyl-diphosphatase
VTRPREWVRARDAAVAARFGTTIPRRSVGAVAHSADGVWSVVLALTLAVLGGARGRAVAPMVIAGWLGTALVVRLIKTSVRRTRPPGPWGERQRRTDPHAFPSGHAARATMLAIVLGAGFGSLALGAVLAVWAIAVAFARVAVGVHYASDVVAGMLVGAGCGAAVVALYGLAT